MPLTFPCSGCRRDVSVRYLRPGERAVCRSCGVETIVPDDARITDQVESPAPAAPLAPMVVAEPPPTSCPACGHPGPSIPRCVACGYEATKRPLYNPKHFPLLAAIFSGLVPLWMAAANWARLGRDDLRRRALGYGVLAYTVLFAGLIVLPEFVHMTGFVERSLRVGMHGLVNLPLGLYLRNRQLAAYASATFSGGTAPAWKGILGGLGLVAGVLMSAVFLTMPILSHDFDRGTKLMKRHDYAGAASAFERALERDPDDQDSRLNAGICEAAAGRLERSVPYLEEYLRHREGDAKGWAILGAVHDALGRPAVGDSCRTVAARLDPQRSGP